MLKELKPLDKTLFSAEKVHMVGIGGSGMRPIAEILLKWGYTLTGSDAGESDNTRRLRELGVPVAAGHSPENVHGADVVVYSAAIHPDNPELIEASRLGIPAIERSDALGALTRRYDRVIGVAGTHGKTTVTSMITQILIENNLDPSAVIGGRLPLIDANGRAGESPYMVCEACEFVDTFLRLSPDFAVLLNIDNDHLDYFGSMENLARSFREFVFLSSACAANGDDPRVAAALDGYPGEMTTFGLGAANDWRAEDIADGRGGGKRFIVVHRGERVCEVSLKIPGSHNVYNALAAFAAASYCGVPAEGIARSVGNFGGAGRRFERLGVFDGVTLVDDYAHHPTEIAATLRAARSVTSGRVVAVFQPFTYSRTALLKDEFIGALGAADSVVLTPIMGSREVNETGISSGDLAAGLPGSVTAGDFSEAAAAAVNLARPGDLVITMGGGDIYKAARLIRDALKARAGERV